MERTTRCIVPALEQRAPALSTGPQFVLRGPHADDPPNQRQRPRRLRLCPYHELESGSRVTEIVREDSVGHQADPEAVSELQQLGIVVVNGNRVGFTEKGEAMVDSMIERMRQAVVPSADGK
jgi:hypothetical protein